MRFRWLTGAVLVAALLVPIFVSPPPAALAVAGECDASMGEVYFPETKKCASKIFYDYWLANGGLAQQGLLMTDDFTEISAADGKSYKVQYFERARFEYHPEQTDPRYKVLLGLVGSEQYKAKYPQGVGTPSNGTCAAGEQFFQQTSYCVPARFYTYWQSHGGLTQQGLPVSPAFMEKNPTDGKEYLTQYFERARFEYHPEIADPNFQVLLGLLGGEQYDAKYPGITPIVGNSLTDPTSDPIPTVDNDTVQTRYDRGGFRMTMKVPNAGWNVSYAPSNSSPVSAIQRLGLNDQRIEVEFTQLAGPTDGSVELFCRRQANNRDRYYQFIIGPNDGYYAILVSFGSGADEFRIIAGGKEAAPLPAVRVGNAPTKMRIDCIGDTFSLYVNGAKVAEAKDSSVTTGEVLNFGVATAKEPGMDVVFRNFTVAIPRR